MINDNLHYTLSYIINHNACFRLFLFSNINISQDNEVRRKNIEAPFSPETV